MPEKSATPTEAISSNETNDKQMNDVENGDCKRKRDEDTVDPNGGKKAKLSDSDTSKKEEKKEDDEEGKGKEEKGEIEQPVTAPPAEVGIPKPFELQNKLVLDQKTATVCREHFQNSCKAGNIYVSNFADALFRQFETGEPDATLSFFDQFTFREEEGKKVVWPLCYFRAVICALNDAALEHLISHEPVSAATSDEWEYVVRVAIGVVVRRAASRALKSEEARVVGDTFENRPISFLTRMPDTIRDLEGAEKYLQDYLQSIEASNPPTSLLLLCYPSSPEFPEFDCLIVFATLKEGKLAIGSRKGLQIKPEEDPKKDASSPWSGVSIQRGASTSKKTTSTNWMCLSHSDIASFFPYSLRRFIPSAPSSS